MHPITEGLVLKIEYSCLSTNHICISSAGHESKHQVINAINSNTPSNSHI